MTVRRRAALGSATTPNLALRNSDLSAGRTTLSVEDRLHFTRNAPAVSHLPSTSHMERSGGCHKRPAAFFLEYRITIGIFRSQPVILVPSQQAFLCGSP